MAEGPVRPASQARTVPVSHGQLEALLQAREQPRVAVVVCHPHPQMGGTMDNPVAYRLARTLFEAGATVLRFNFRGVGRSTGTFDGGRGEQEDVEAALAYLLSQAPGVPVWVAGYSFGAFVGLTVGARHPAVSGLLGVGLALSIFDHAFLAGTEKPRALLQGSEDTFGGRDAAQALVDSLPGRRKLWVLPGADHLFSGQLPVLERTLAEAAAWLGP